MGAVGDRSDFGLTVWDRSRILRDNRTIAMVGLSANEFSASSFAAIYLTAHGYDIVPVNPAHAGKRKILGKPVYASLAEAAVGHDRVIDVVDVFRPVAEAPGLAEQAVAIKARVFWLQLDLVSPEAAEVERAGGLEVVMDRCMKLEHARFFGGLHTIGLNTGIITSRRGVG